MDSPSVSGLLLRQSHGMRWEVEADDAVCALVAARNGRVPLSVLLPRIASSVDADEDGIAAALLDVVADLIQRGLLLPEAT